MGATLTVIMAVVIPWAAALAGGHTKLRFDLSRVAGVAILLVANAVAGGVVVLKLGHASNTDDAFLYGISWETLLAGGFNGANAFFSKRTKSPEAAGATNPV